MGRVYKTYSVMPTGHEPFGFNEIFAWTCQGTDMTYAANEAHRRQKNGYGPQTIWLGDEIVYMTT